jgi:hypothetical protein
MPAPKAENGFFAEENCFVGQGGTKQLAKNQVISIRYDQTPSLDWISPHACNRSQNRRFTPQAAGPLAESGVVHWPMAAMNSGAG